MSQATREVLGAQTIVSALEELGVTIAFGLPGVHNLPLWSALRESPIRLVGVRHEQTAAYAADGYSRATGSLGVALVTTGPGAANTLGATGEAMASGSPVLVIATDIATSLRREGIYRGTLHETRDQTAMFGPVTKSAHAATTADELHELTMVSGRRALEAPSGPVYLGVPTDLLGTKVSSSEASEGLAQQRVTRYRPAAGDLAAPTADELARAAELLSHARRPLIWAGGGAVRSGAGDLVGELATRIAAPVITTYMGRGLLPPDHPCAAPGPAHAEPVGRLWDRADVVLAVGTDFDGMMTQNWLMPAPPTLIAINIDRSDANKNYPADLTLVGDARGVLQLLVPQVITGDRLPELTSSLAALQAEIAAAVAVDDGEAAAFLEITERVLPPEAVIVADMCIPGYWLAGFRRVPLPRKLSYPMGWGTLGFGFPASLGAAMADAGPAVCVTGDGGFLFACGELATVVEQQLPLTIVLFDDGGYGMLRFDQVQAGSETFGVDLLTPDFEALAKSFGVQATAVEGVGSGFETELRAAISAGVPRMIVVNAALKPPPTTSPRWYRRLAQC